MKHRKESYVRNTFEVFEKLALKVFEYLSA